ncbi:DUF1858 domain-containing protein [Tateyamaria armeniaca]|uniref:DUF1858 domain-containing protein n=1 Tax=Tateyamaria armeniaca TaxID=2518930 RepID=A0ABW8UVV3_9RHOB
MPCPKITDPDLSLEDLMAEWPQTVSVFLRHNMLCVGCIIAPFHTVTDACREYHLNQDAFMYELLDAARLV